MNKIADISGYIELDNIPVCPLCDNGIEDLEESIVVTANNYKCLIHQDCFDDIDYIED